MADSKDFKEKYTEFGPLTTENKPKESFFSRIFGRRGSENEKTVSAEPKIEKLSQPADIQASGSIQPVSAPSNSPTEESSQMRQLPPILGRIQDIINKRSITPQQYKDSDFQQYWLPDSSSRSCYTCQEKFNAFRRRHHCRFCGQIFCSKCCSFMIPGKLLGYIGEIRSCTYCCAVLVWFLQNCDLSVDLVAELKNLKEKLQQSNDRSLLDVDFGFQLQPHSETPFKKLSYGFLEENFVQELQHEDSNFDLRIDKLIDQERKCILLDYEQLQHLCSLIFFGPNALRLESHKYRFKSFPDCFSGKELVEWFMKQSQASSKQSAIAIGEALIKAGLIICLSQSDQSFVDDYVLYQPVKSKMLCEMPPTTSHESQIKNEEPLWVKEIPTQAKTENEEPEQLMSVSSVPSLSNSSSSYFLDLNIEENVVSVSRPKSSDDIESVGVISPGSDSHTSSVSNALSASAVPMMGQRISSKGGFVIREGYDTSQNIPSESESTELDSTKQADPLMELNLQMQSKLNSLWDKHESSLLTQLLSYSNLPLSWHDIILPVVYTVSKVVKPDVKNENDAMDIRQYVHFKKISGHTRSQCDIVNGIVCTKNFLYRDMSTRLTNPQILLLASSIDYQRGNEPKLLSLEDVLRQGTSYLNNTVMKIVSHKPNIILLEKGIAFTASQQLKDAEISVAAYVKRSVMERVSRCTQSKIVTSIDAQLSSHCLGMCHNFYIRSTVSAESSKPLMFFDGCATHLGCTVILKGPSMSELRKIKRILSFMIFSHFNWKHEKSFLIDEFAFIGTRSSKPSPQNCKNEDKNPISAVVPENRGSAGVTKNLNEIFSSEKMECGSPETENKKKLQENVKHCGEDSKELKSEAISSGSLEFLSQTCLEDDQLAGKLMKKRVSSQERCSPSKEIISDQSDPLQQSLLFGSPRNSMTHHSITEENIVFEKFLKSTILSVSPIVKFNIPFLLSEEGKKSSVKGFICPRKYYSNLFNDNAPSRVHPSPTKKIKKMKKVEYLEPHDFLKAKLVKPASSDEVAASLALFRACGGSMRIICKCEQKSDVYGGNIDETAMEAKESIANVEATNEEVIKKYDLPMLTDERKLDIFHPFNHQRIPVLFSVFSQSFQVTSTFCVNPRVVQMEFYGKNDIPLGAFLESYCFSTSYSCPSPLCSVATGSHVRKFAYQNGCVEVLIRKLDSPLVECETLTIYMWNWCKFCSQVSPVVPMSSETWSFSFAKYLELRFNDNNLIRRGIPGCGHSIHQDHFHYFAKKNIVGIVKYIPICTRELLIPSFKINYTLQSIPEYMIVDMVKCISVQGYSVFSLIQEHLLKMSEDSSTRFESLFKAMIAHYNKQRQIFREKIENVQLLMTSPSVQSKWINTDNFSDELKKSIGTFEIYDQICILKKHLMSVINDWNTKVQEYIPLRKKEEKMEKSKLNQARLSSTSSTHTTSSILQAGLTEGVGVATSDDNEAKDVLSDKKRPSRTVSDSTTEESKNASLEDLPSQENSAEEEDGSSPPTDLPDLGPIDRAREAVEKSTPEKRTVKNIITSLWSSPSDLMVKVPFDIAEHHILLPEVKIPIPVYDEEPSSIIAHALASEEYEKRLSILQRSLLKEVILQQDSTSSARLSTNQDTVSDSLLLPPEGLQNDLNNPEDEGKLDQLKDPHIELQFSDDSADFYCKIFFAEHFRRLRSVVFNGQEEMYLRSLSHCIVWDAKGGKSGSFFCKTNDDRFILKEMSRFEITSFLDFGSSYIRYVMTNVRENHPMALTKIVGVYRICFKNYLSAKMQKMDFLVMENLFYQRSISHKFDLKGSVRNRLVTTTSKTESEVVLLDENLLKMACSSPLYLRTHSKEVLTKAIKRDSAFLTDCRVMDYSLLVGIDQETNQLVVGIIDYVRTFTWDKKLETLLKGSVLGGSTGKLPTIVSPSMYQNRFCEAMEKYFVIMPDNWWHFEMSNSNKSE